MSTLSKVIFLLGAGASHDAKLPLMAELTTGFPPWPATTTLESKDRDRLLFAPFGVSDEHLKEWIEFLRHCGGFEVW